jgi:hypothetical protein
MGDVQAELFLIAHSSPHTRISEVTAGSGMASIQRVSKRSKSPQSPEDVERAEEAARKKLRKRLWRRGALFHVTSRYPWKRGARKVDRLASILRNGLVAPAQCRDGSVRSDLNLVMSGCSVPYDSLVFLHRFGKMSYLYTFCEPGRFAVFVDPSHPVITQEEMAEPWVILCLDEVYVPGGIALEHLTGIAICPADADSVLNELHAELRQAAIPLYTYDGQVLWPPV